MHIGDEHLYHGAALNQVLEHGKVVTVTPSQWRGRRSRSSFRVIAGRSKAGLMLKCCKTKPTKPFKEYRFNFNRDHLDELKRLRKSYKRAFVGLVCGKAREICGLSADEVIEMFRLRQEKGYSWDVNGQMQVCVVLEKRRQFRAYANWPHMKPASKLGECTVPRNRFPGCLFG